MSETIEMLLKRALSTFAGLCVLSMPGLAKPETGGFRRISVPANYLLKPGDQLEIVVDSLPEAEKIYQIRSDGNIQHAVAGEIKVAGKNLLDIERVLKQRLSFSLKRPTFKLGIYSVAEIEVSALGELSHQGKFLLNTGSSMLDLLAQCGGLTDKADVSDCILVRGDQKLAVNMKDRTLLGTMKLVDNDVFMVSPGKRVTVNGEVRQPGQFTVSFKSPTPIDDALVLAGGASEKAALQRVLVVRPTLRTPIVVDLNDRDKDGQLTHPVEILDGDTVSVQPLRCAVLGGVDKPGQVILTGNETLFDIVSAAGSSRGRLDEVVVIRAADVAAGTEKREVYNLQEAFTDLKSIPKVSINDGDVVFVPPVDPNAQGGIFSAAMPLMNLVWMARSLFAF